MTIFVVARTPDCKLLVTTLSIGARHHLGRVLAMVLLPYAVVDGADAVSRLCSAIIDALA